MAYREFRDRLCRIDYSKSCLEFLAERIASDGYRGIQISQHNRYDMDLVYTLLDEIYKLVGDNKMQIRTTDLSKRPYNLPEESNYALYTNEVNKKVGRGTQDSVRKNLFVDLHRMGLIKRFNAGEELVGPEERGTKKYVQLSENGLDFINPSLTLFERRLRYTRAIDTLSKGLADELLDIALLDGELSDVEFQFFLSFIGEELNGHTYTKTELLDFIKEFRMMSKFQQQAVVKLVQEYCTPSNFSGDKTNKRDYHNWMNETQQIFMLMGQTAYFEVDDGSLVIRVGKDALYENKEKFIRSRTEKEEYFKQHDVVKTYGFELHHIVPLCWAKNALEFSTLDVWKNLIYIDGYKHSIITQKNNEHVKLAFVGEDISFKNYADDEILCESGVNVLYNPKNKSTMLTYNQQLLHSVGTMA